MVKEAGRQGGREAGMLGILTYDTMSIGGFCRNVVLCLWQGCGSLEVTVPWKG